MDDANEATAGAAAGLLPPIEGYPAGVGQSDGPWQPSILRAVVQQGGCLRCALRMAGVRRPAAFQVGVGIVLGSSDWYSQSFVRSIPFHFH